MHYFNNKQLDSIQC